MPPAVRWTPASVPQAFTATESPLPPDTTVVEAPMNRVRSSQELDNAETIFTTVGAAALGSADFPPPYRMWLPPLEVKTLDEIEPSLQHWAAPAAPRTRLKVPMGLFDDPLRHAQPLWTVDTTDQNVLIIGGAQAGKSTAVKTLVCSWPCTTHGWNPDVSGRLLQGAAWRRWPACRMWVGWPAGPSPTPSTGCSLRSAPSSRTGPGCSGRTTSPRWPTIGGCVPTRTSRCWP